MILNINKLSEILIKILAVLIIIVLIFYFGLWIYVYRSVPDELKQDYHLTNVLEFSDEQFQIIWFALTENKRYNFNWYPFIIEALFRDPKDNADRIASMFIMFSNNMYVTSPFRASLWNIEYGLARYIRRDNDYKKCLSLIITKAYMGNEIYGIFDASEYYYSKNIDDLTIEELVSLIILINSPTRNAIGSLFSYNKIEEIVNKYYE